MTLPNFYMNRLRYGQALMIFLYLQVLDFMTTFVGMRLGLGEAIPMSRALMRVYGPTAGLLIVKAIAIVLGFTCVRLHKFNALKWGNYFFAALAVWNLIWIALAAH